MIKTDFYLITDPFYQDDILSGTGYCAEDDDVIELQSDHKSILIREVNSGEIIISRILH